MKKHLAKNKTLPKISVLLVILSLVVAASIFPSLVQAETDSSVTDFIKQNKENSEDPSQGKDTPAKSGIEQNQDSDPAPVGLTAWDYIKTLSALAFVIALIYGMVKFINTRNRVTQNGKLMQNMGGLSLGQQKSIQLVKIGENYFLIGVGEDVRLLKELSNPDELAQLASYYSEEVETMQQSPLLKLINGFKGRKTNPYQQQDETEDFRNLFKTKLAEVENERKRKLNQLTEKERNRNE